MQAAVTAVHKRNIFSLSLRRSHLSNAAPTSTISLFRWHLHILCAPSLSRTVLIVVGRVSSSQAIGHGDLAVVCPGAVQSQRRLSAPLWYSLPLPPLLGAVGHGLPPRL